MSVLPVLLFYTLLFQWSSEASVKDPEFMLHMKRVRSYPCKHPRPTSLKISELTGVGVVDKIFVPEVTVLHRCDAGSGCCSGPSFFCGPAETEPVYLKFFVNDIINKKQGYEIIEERNHTKCHCIEADNNPRRILYGGFSKSSVCDRLSIVQILTVVSALLWKFSF